MTDLTDQTSFTAEQELDVLAALEHLNSSHPDTVLFVARHLGGTAVEDAEATAADRHGATFTALVNGTEIALRAPFDEPLATPADLHLRLMEHLQAARAADPDAPLTSTEREMRSMASLPTHHVTVSAVEDVTPTLRQITFRGIDPGPNAGGDEFIYVIVPRPGEDALPAESTMWSLREGPEDEIPPMAYYTIRRWRPETREVDAWFVLHDNAHGVSGWASAVEPGARCALWGPRRGFEVPEGTTSVMLFVDETGLPAAYSLTETLPADTQVLIVAETADSFALPPPPEHPGLTMQHHTRGPAAPGEASTLVDAARAMAAPTANERASLVVFGAAESRRITAVRKFVRTEWGLPATQVSCVGYWRRDQ